MPDYGLTLAPSKGAGPFILTEEGQARLWCRSLMRDGPFPAHYEPFESPMVNLVAPKIRGNPARVSSRMIGSDSVPRRSSPTRRRLPSDRTLSLLDQACVNQRHSPTGVFRRDRRGACQREGYQQGRLGSCLVEAWLGQGQGGRHKADQAADVRQQTGPRDRRAHPLGVHRPGDDGLRRQHAHSLRRRRPTPTRPSSRLFSSMSSAQTRRRSPRGGINGRLSIP